jgi:predicted DCC family thiol-disulfide oxidoreductase YuxK
VVVDGAGQGIEPGTVVAVAFVEDRLDELHRCVVARLALDAALREEPYATSRSARLAWPGRTGRIVRQTWDATRTTPHGARS